MNTMKNIGLASIIALAGCKGPKELPMQQSAQADGTYVAPANCARILSANYHREEGYGYSAYQLSVACADTTGNVAVYRLETDGRNPEWKGVRIELAKNHK